MIQRIGQPIEDENSYSELYYEAQHSNDGLIDAQVKLVSQANDIAAEKQSEVNEQKQKIANQIKRPRAMPEPVKNKKLRRGDELIMEYDVQSSIKSLSSIGQPKESNVVDAGIGIKAKILDVDNKKKRDLKSLDKTSKGKKMVKDYFSTDQGLERSHPTHVQIRELAVKYKIEDPINVEVLKQAFYNYVYLKSGRRGVGRAIKHDQNVQRLSKQFPSEIQKERYVSIEDSILEKVGSLNSVLEYEFLKELFKVLNDSSQNHNFYTAYKKKFLHSAIEMYFKTFETLSGQIPLTSNLFKSLTPFEKLEAWFKCDPNELQKRFQIKIVAQEIVSNLNVLEMEEIMTLPVTTKSKIFFAKLLLSDGFPTIKFFNSKLLCALTVFGLLRDQIMPLVDDVGRSDYESEVDFNLNQHSTQLLLSAVRDMVQMCYKLLPSSSLMITRHPQQLLFDRILALLKPLPYRDQVLKVIFNLNNQGTDPYMQVSNMITEGSQYIWTWAYLQDFKSEGLVSFSNVTEFFMSLGKYPYKRQEVIDLLNSGNIANHNAMFCNEIRSHQSVTKALLIDNDDEALKLANDAGLLQELQDVCVASKLWAAASNNTYHHSAMLCLHALQSVMSGSRVTVIQMDYGNGKSFLLLLSAYIITVKLKKQVVITSANQSLIAQLKDKSEKLYLRNTTFCPIKQLNQHFNDETIILVDEYNWSLTHEKFETNLHGQLNPIFTAGLTRTLEASQRMVEIFSVLNLMFNAVRMKLKHRKLQSKRSLNWFRTTL